MEQNKNVFRHPEYPIEMLEEYTEELFLEAIRRADIMDAVGDMPVDRLRELAQADREGRCVVLPCNPGDFVWVITERGSRCVERWIVHRVYKRDVGGWYFDLKNMMLSQKRPNEFEMCKKAVSSFGKTLFLTREAALAALKGEQDG